MMKRIEALKVIHRLRTEQPMVIGVGYQGPEIFSLGDNDLNLRSVNLPYPAPMGLGLALALPNQKVIVSEGDGSAVSGMSTLCTIGNMAPKNLIHIVWDNGAWMANGHFKGGHFGPFPTATGGKADFAEIAKSAGVKNAFTIRTEEELERIFSRALTEDGPFLLVVKVDTTTLYNLPPLTFGITEMSTRFRRTLVNRGWVSPWHAGATLFKDSSFEFSAEDGADKGVAVTYQRLKGVQPEKLPRLGVEYARTIYSSLKAAGINMTVYLPDSSNYLIQRFANDDPQMLSVSVTREDEGMAIAMGAFMGGKTPCLIMEASGLGLCYLALAWLGIQMRMATLILTSHTDGLGEYTDYHVCTRYVVEPLLRGMNIPHYTMMSIAEAPRLIKQATMTVRGQVFPVVIQLPRHVLWEDPN
jgi:sulfopyruvate decarboxylase TPP-binding subunit